jgi:hypothetical protein
LTREKLSGATAAMLEVGGYNYEDKRDGKKLSSKRHCSAVKRKQ